MVQKIGRGGNERGEEEKEEEEEDEEEDEQRKRTKRTKEEGRGRSEEERGGEGRGGEGGGESVENLVRGESFKAKAKLNQNKAKSTKHAGRPADFYNIFSIYY